MSSLTLRLQKTIQAPQESAYNAFIRPDQLSRWFTKSATAGLSIGGRYSNSDGDRGEFLVLEPPRRVAFTWDNPQHCPGTVVTANFGPLSGGQVEVTLEHSPLASQAEYDDMSTGWSWALDSLKSYLETGAAIPYEDWVSNRRARE